MSTRSQDPTEPEAALRRALGAVNGRIERACSRAGRAPDTVRLIAVSKTFSAERVRQAVACGQTLFGENRVQEALEKIPAVGPGAAWHMVGHLQRNKARQAVGRFELIHGVDGDKLALALDRLSGEAGVRQPVLIQVNLSREPTKFGIDETELPVLAGALVRLEHVDLRGLMTIPPPAEQPEDSRILFARLRKLRDRLVSDLGLELPELSMGMSDDFEVAVEEGATLVRVGRALFGERNQ